MATILVEILGNSKQFKRELEGTIASTERASGGFSKMGMIAGTAGLALGGVLVAGLVKSVDAAGKFQSSMELIQTQAGGTTKEVHNMSKALLNMASQVGTSPEELSKGLYHVESAGFRGAKALSILRLAAEGAKVGHADLEQTTTALVAAQRSGIKGLGDMSHAMGSLNAIVGAGNMRMDDLTSALGTGILPVAKAFGLSISDVGAALATMTSNGVPAVNAAAGLKMMFASLSAPTHQASKALESIGLSSTDLADTMRSKGLNAALLELKGHLKGAGLNSTETAALLTTAFGKKSSTPLLTLIGNLKDMKSAQDQIKTGARDFGANWEETQKTSEFATARFKAAIDALEIQVGAKLLPTVTRFTNWLTDELPVAIAEAKKIIEQLTPTFLSIRDAVQQVVDFVRDHWSEIHLIIKGEIDQIVGMFNLLGDLLHGRWSKIWDDVKQIMVGKIEVIKGELELVGPYFVSAMRALGELAVRGLVEGLKALPGALEAGLKALPGLAKSAAEKVGEEIVKGIKWAVPHLAGIAGDLTAKLTDALNQLKGWAVKAFEAVGRAIADGVKHGLTSAWASVSDTLDRLTFGMVGTAQKSIKAKSPSQEFSDKVGLPIAQGIIQGLLLGTAPLNATMTTAMQNAVNAGRAVIQSAQASFQTAWQAIASDADAAFSGIKGAAKTPAEKQLAAMQEGKDAAARNKAVADAQAAITAGKDAGDPTAVIAAQHQLEDALYAIQVASLQKQAEAERLNLDAKNALEQRHFDAALGNLQLHLAKGHASYEEAHKAILDLFKKFGVNYSAAGADLGRAFVTGLKESIQGAASKSGSLSGKLSDVAAGIHIPHAATGGFVEQTGVAVIHQGETITPAGQGGGVTVVVNGWVGNDQDIATKVQNTLIRMGRNTTGGVLGGFA